MRIYIFSAGLFCVAISVLATSVDAQRTNRSNWKTIDAEGLFTFTLPAGFKQTETGIDSFMRGYKRGRAEFIFVCGDSASREYDEKKMRGLREDATTTNGKYATVRTFVYRWERTSDYVIELNVGNWRDGRVELYMGMESPNRADIQTAKRIFKSVQFLKTGCA